MIYEIRTYDLKLRSLREVIKRFGDVIEKRQALSTLAGFWYTEFGPLNQIVHIWTYESADERARIRAESVKTDFWPPKIGEFVLKQTVEVCNKWDFVPELTPGDHGPYYEMRSYLIYPGKMPITKERWQKALPERTKRSPMATLLECDIGTASKIIHLWPYKSLDERMAIRSKAEADGIWPPKSGDVVDVLSQENKLMLPAPFSPMQ